MRIGTWIASTVAIGAVVVVGYLTHEYVTRRELIAPLSARAATLDQYCAAQYADLATVLHDLASGDRQSRASDEFSAMHEFEAAQCVYERVAAPEDHDDSSSDRLFCNKVFGNDMPCMARIVVTQLATWR